MRRFVVEELLDTGSPDEIAASLHDMGRVNRWFGGVSTTRKMVRHVAEHCGKRELSILDVASGSGELPQIVQKQLRQLGLRLEVTLLDKAAGHLNGSSNGVVADALSMPFPDGEFDIVTSSLFLHHLEPCEIRRCINESLRVARIAVIINDLRRSKLHLVAAYAGRPLFCSRLSRHDAPASVRSAYTTAELRHVLLRTRASRIQIAAHYLFRLGAIAWK